ncbi:hypothetical protein VTL71DRAFT_8859 [Oculimacula yallundae]|uniref:Uncharacterized protein n=1 Tax=Oculimacula yallundae TaxID=86028 RepID=A0ABR4BT21_9HELO
MQVAGSFQLVEVPQYKFFSCDIVDIRLFFTATPPTTNFIYEPSKQHHPNHPHLQPSPQYNNVNMADNAKKGAWSDAENVSPHGVSTLEFTANMFKYALIYQIVQQLIGDGKAIKWNEITLPGRTTRALSERWHKIKTDVNAAGISTQGAPGVPVARPARGPNGGKKTKAESKGTPIKRKEEDTDMNDATPTPKRHKTPVKKEEIKAESEDDNGEADQSDDDA